MSEDTRQQAEDRRMRDRLHYRNLQRIRPDDIIVASAGAAGQTLLANILLELNLTYINPATEVMHPDGTTEPEKELLAYRGRFAAMHAKDRARSIAAPRGPRFVKTHLHPDEFDQIDFAGVWLLVRDPRDALFSLYKFRRDFADVAWEKVPDTFQGFLDRVDYTGTRPVDDWTEFNDAWSRRAEHCRHTTVTRFEDLKQDGPTAVGTALRAFGLDLPDEEIARAVENSSFENMRAHEDTVAAQDRDKGQFRIMRKGKVGEWTEWMTPDLHTYFSAPRAVSVAARFGYELNPGPDTATTTLR